MPHDLVPEFVGDGFLAVDVRDGVGEPGHDPLVLGQLVTAAVREFGGQDAGVVPAVPAGIAAVHGRAVAAAVDRRDAEPDEVAVRPGDAGAGVGLHRDHRGHRARADLLALVCTHTPSTRGRPET